MGFHKRRISKEGIIRTYNDTGIEGIKRLFSADALIVEMGIDTDKIIDYLTENNEEGLLQIVLELGGEKEMDK
jgi:hypothetical protein